MLRNRFSILTRKKEKRIDHLLFLSVIFLTVFGMLMIFEASNISAYRDFGDKLYYAREQFYSFLLGVFCMVLFSKIDYRKLATTAVPLMFFCIISLLAVFIPGIGVKAMGAHRWINLKVMNFQPSELTKLAVVLYLAAWLSVKEKGRFASFIVLLGIVVGLVVIQPDLGTAIILSCIFMATYFLSGAPLWHFFVLLPVSLSGIAFLAVTSPYRYQRIMTFLNPDQDPLGMSYHIRQILISFGSGGWFGVGLGASIQKYQYLPEATTDSIFAIIGEEFGFFGSLIFTFIMLFLIHRIYLIVRSAPDKLSYLISSGILSLIAFQVIVNLGAMVAIFPLTGTPLPFVSYGGSSLIVMMIAIGILLNISKHGNPVHDR